MREGYSTAPDYVRELGFGAGMGLPNMKRFSDKDGRTIRKEQRRDRRDGILQIMIKTLVKIEQLPNF